MSDSYTYDPNSWNPILAGVVAGATSAIVAALFALVLDSPNDSDGNSLIIVLVALAIGAASVFNSRVVMQLGKGGQHGINRQGQNRDHCCKHGDEFRHAQRSSRDVHQCRIGHCAAELNCNCAALSACLLWLVRRKVC